MASAALILILSDTHGFLDPRIAALAGDCDTIVHAGDIGAGRVLTQLRHAAPAVVAVRGNNDTPAKWPAGEREVLEALPWEAALDLPGGRLVIVHGHQSAAGRRHDWLRRHYPMARAVVYGHSHRLVLERDQEPWILNPGAAGRTRTFGGPSCLWLHASKDGWRLWEARFPQ